MSGYQVERGDVLLSVQVLLTEEEEGRQAASGPRASARVIPLHRPAPRPPAPAAGHHPAAPATPPRPAWESRSRTLPVGQIPPAASMVDPTTGAGTNLALERDVKMELAAAGGGQPPALVALTVLGLDQVRLSMGNDAAEDALKAMVEVAPFALRARDRIYRAGRNQMALLLPATDRPSAEAARASLELAFGPVLSGRGYPELKLEARSIQLTALAS